MKWFDQKNKQKKIFQAQKGPAFLSSSLQGYLNGCSIALSPLINKSALGQAKSCEHA